MMSVNWILLMFILSSHTPVSPGSLVIGIISSKASELLTTNITKTIEEVLQALDIVSHVTVDIHHVTLSKSKPLLVPRQVCKLVASGATVLISTAPCLLSQLAWGAVWGSGVPLVYAGLNPCPVHNQNLSGWYNVHVYHAAIANVMIDVIVKDNWKDTVIFYDNQHEMYVSEISTGLSAYNIEALSINISNRNISLLMTYRDMLKHQDNFIVICSMMASAWLLKNARLGYLELLGPKYKWLLPDYGDLNQARVTSLLWEGDNVAIVTKSKEEPERMQIQINSLAQWITESINQTFKVQPWSEPHQQCSNLTDWPFGQELYNMLQNMSGAIEPSTVPQYSIRSVAVAWSGGLYFPKVGSWNLKTGLELGYYLFPKLHQGYNNRTFIVTTLPYPPFVYKYDNGTYGGICFDLLNELAKRMNFSYIVLEPVEEVWGIKGPDGHFTGLMGLVERKEVDFGVGPFGMEKTREVIADFTTPFWGDPSIILMKKPDLATYKIFICLGPFSFEVWLLLILSVLGAGAFMWTLFWFDPNNDRHITKKEGIYDPQITMWQTYGALMQQGMVYMPESHSGRVLVAMWWLYVIIMVGTYNGNLIAFLTAPKVDTPVNNLQELAESNMLVGTMRNAMLHGLFETTTDPDDVYKLLWDKIKEEQESLLVDDPADGVNRVLLDKSYAFLVEKSYYDTLNNKNWSFSNKSCEFARAKEDFFPTMYGFPFQKGSPYVEKFSVEMLRILEAGLLKRWKHKWYSYGNRCTGLERTTAQTNISLAEAQGAFYILGIGLIVASISLSAEKCYEFRKRRRSRVHDSNEPNEFAMTAQHSAHNGEANTMVNFWTPAAFLDSSIFTLPSIMGEKSSKPYVTETDVNRGSDFHAQSHVSNGSVHVANGSLSNGYISNGHINTPSSPRRLRSNSEPVSSTKPQKPLTRREPGRSKSSLHRKNAQYKRSKKPGLEQGLKQTRDNYNYYEYTPKNRLFNKKQAPVANGHIRKDAETGEYA